MLRFKDITVADVDTIASMHAESWRTAYRGILRDDYLDGDVHAERRRTWTERLTHLKPDHFGVIAFQNDAPAGFAFVFGKSDSRWGNEVDNLHVIKSLRGTGVGRQLLGAVAERVRARGLPKELFLWVYEKNSNARGFYARLGAREEDTIIVTAPDGSRVPEVRCVWNDAAALIVQDD